MTRKGFFGSPQMIFWSLPSIVVSAELPIFPSAIINYYIKEHSLWVSALNSNIFLNGRFRLDIFRGLVSLVLAFLK